MSVSFLYRTILVTTLAVLVAAAPTETPRGGIIIPLTRQRKARANTAISPRKDPPLETELDPSVAGPIPELEIRSLVDLHGEITIGDQSYSVIFDTLDADIRLPGEECKQCESCGKVIYKSKGDPGLAPMYRDDPDDDDEPSQGKVFTDAVKIGHLTVEDQAIAAVDKMSLDLLKSTADGYVGMGPPSMSLSEEESLFENMVLSQHLDQSVFAFLLRPKKDCYSELSLGFVNPKMHELPEIEYIPMKSESSWSVDVSFSVFGETVIESEEAMIDTSSDFISGTFIAVDQIYRKIPGSARAGNDFPLGMYTISCSTKDLPPISLTFGQSKRSFTINPENFIRRAPYRGCYGALVASKALPVDWVIGSPFLYDVYAVFDVTEGKAQIGFDTVPEAMRCASLASS